MKKALMSTLLGSLLAVSGAAMAQEQVMQPMPQMTAPANTGIGMVNRVDMQTGKINLTHGPIKSLGWPGMTMDFKVSDRALLNDIRSGEKVEFEVARQDSGQFYVVRIVPVH